MSSFPISISPEREAQVTKTVTTWYLNFEKPFDDSFTIEEFGSTFHPDIEWLDHAFRIRRVGREAILGLRTAWLHCNQPFRSELKALIPTAEGAVVELLWIGRCANDIIRPDGEIAVKASGKDYKCHLCLVMKIDEHGKIVRIDEYYNKAWDDGVHESQYSVVKGASLKSSI